MNYSLNEDLVEQLKKSLSKNEAKLAHYILYQLFPKPLSLNVPILPASEIKLLPFLQFLEEHISEIEDSPVKLAMVNQAIWKFVEILEGNVAELFQRIKMLEIYAWTGDLYAVVTDIKELLLFYIDKLIEAIKKLETIFQKLKKKTIFTYFRNFFGSTLNRNLAINLLNTKIFLNQNYSLFQSKFQAFSDANYQIAKKTRKFKYFLCFPSLEKDLRQSYLHLYRITKIWEKNQQLRIFLRSDFLKIMKQHAPFGQSYLVLKRYLEKMIQWFFHLTAEWRLEKSSIQKEKIDLLEKELDALAIMIEKYRDLILNTDPNPYVRSRLGFQEWVVGPEPKRAEELRELSFRIDAIKKLFLEFKHTANQEHIDDPKVKQYRLKNAINNILHEMAQPLAPKDMIRYRMDKLMKLIDECDELGGSAGDVESLITNTLLRAFQLDWHTQVLFENPQFEQLWLIHVHSEKLERDFAHEKRMAHFRKMISHIERWVIQHEPYKHVHELETDLTDAKEQFQEYLSQVKRRFDALDGIERAFFKDQVKLQLLEYYELFSRFFFFLRKNESNGKIILNQFQFIDQYLEATRQLFE